MSKEEKKEIKPKTSAITWAAVVIALVSLSTTAASFSNSAFQTHDTTSLGSWANFPTSAACSPLPTAFAGSCELLGNESYRRVFQITSSLSESGINAYLSVSCTVPSNTVGATLQLQWANYSQITHLNSSNFASLSSTVLVDNSANNACPGTITSAASTLPALQSGPAIMFRVVGFGGGGAGDTVRFSDVSVLLSQTFQRIYQIQIAAPSTVHFLWKAYSNMPVIATTTFTIEWIATNETSVGCTLSTSSCIQSGTSSCTFNTGSNSCSATITVNFVNAFVGTPTVVATTTIGGFATQIPLASLNLMSAETLTV